MGEYAFCPKCGNRITSNFEFCPKCGISLASVHTANGSGARIPAWQRVEMAKATQESANSSESELSKGISSQPVYQQQEIHPNAYSLPEEQFPEKPMKWYKFVIYFQLIAGAIFNGLNALNYLLGGAMDLVPYLPNRDLYHYYSGLQTVDIVYGLAVIGLVILSILARSNLKNFTERGPKLYLSVLTCNAIFPIAYTFLVSTVVPDLTIDTGIIIGQLIAHAIIISLNVVYFKKRDHLFCCA